jgi:Alr-MurF fusion protein
MSRSETWTIAEVAQAVGGKYIGPNPNAEIRFLQTDSRKIFQSSRTLFIALITGSNNGHRYIPELVGMGVPAFLVSEMPEKNIPKSHFILVENTLNALQNLAKAHRSAFRIPVVGITGSHGKTIVKEWAAQMLSKNYAVLKNPGSFNSQIGVPLSVWRLRKEHQIALFEAGISEKGEMDKLEAIIQPEIGLFTNIGSPHSAHFSSLEEKLEEKFQLFKHCKTIVYCRDHSLLHTRISQMPEKELITWSFTNPEASLLAKKVKEDLGQTTLEIHWKGTTHLVELPFTDEPSLENALQAITLAVHLGVPLSMVAEAASHLESINMRLEIAEALYGCSLINDSYSSDLDALKLALDYQEIHKRNMSKTVVMTDIQQSAEAPMELYSKVAEMIHHHKVDRFIGIGEELSKFRYLFGHSAIFFPNAEAMLARWNDLKFENEIILLKGARKFKLEQLAERLRIQEHESRYEIKLPALAHNLAVFRRMLKPKTKIMAMVKAYSYGSGGAEIATLLQYHGVEYLGVAYFNEGASLRKAGITLPIMVMNSETSAFRGMVRYKLEPEIFSLRSLNTFIKIAEEEGLQEYPIHLKLETGMNRLGLAEQDLDEALEKIRSTDGIRVASVFSHLAASDNATHEAFTISQIERFEKATELIAQVLDYLPMRHILNSGGLDRLSPAHFEMVRLGIGLYGIHSNTEVEKKLELVGALHSHVSQIKEVKKGESVGYDRAFVAEKDSRTATIPLGYADGLSRALGMGRGKIYWQGRALPIIGKVCMDMVMVDIGRLPIAEGDKVTVFENQAQLRAIADETGTIPYEILTSISQRVRRVYYHE